MKIKALGITIMATVALVGCQGENGNDNAEPNNDSNVEQTRFNAGDGNATNDGENRQDFDMNDMNQDNNENGNNSGNNNNEYDIADKAAKKISKQVNGIDNVNVVTTDNNAYVAAELDTTDNGNNNTANNNKNNNNKNDTKNINNNNGNNNNNKGNGDEITDDTKKKISDIVKSTDKDIDNVYVSTNPDFVDLVTNYANQAENGEPIEGLFDQMGNMIERVFPQEKE